MASNRVYRKYSNNLPVVISIALVLYVLGIFGLFFWNAYKLSREVQDNLKFEVFFDESASDEDVKNLQEDLKNKPFVRKLNFISKDEAALNFMQQFGEDFTEVLQFNPLKASLEVFLNNDLVTQDGLQELIKNIETNNGVFEVKYSRPVVENIGAQLRTLSIIFLLLIFLLLIIALALINNSIRLSFYAQRFLIKSMQLVGATKRFILRPYLSTALFQGFLGALIAVTLITATVFSIIQSFPITKPAFEPNHLFVIYGAIIILGILITTISSMIVMRKYLRRSVYELY